ncbi:5706_t:CDS:1, partial [Ambispora gerdemannii]
QKLANGYLGSNLMLDDRIQIIFTQTEEYTWVFDSRNKCR